MVNSPLSLVKYSPALYSALAVYKYSPKSL
nr:MAG TPA: hypothetical protein [Bacteriophage sp.]